MTGPKLLPKKKAVARPVYLEPEVWDQLKDAARFHSEVFEEMGAGETVSRNDIIASFLEWALDEYWKDKGGPPTSKEDWTKKLRKHAEKLLADAARTGSAPASK